MKLDPGVTALVTGAANGIGRATSEALAGCGCAVALVDWDERGLDETAQRVMAAGGSASRHVVDVADRARVANLAREIGERHPSLEILVNSAGVALSGRFEDLALDDIQWLFDANFWGVVYSCHFLLPLLKRARGAVIVNLLSPLALIGAPGKTAYAASKFAVRGLSESLASELGASAVRIIRVYPGPVKTGIVERGRAANRDAQRREGEFLAKHGLAPARVAKAIVRAIRGRSRRVLVGLGACAVDVAGRLAPDLAVNATALVARRLQLD